MQNYYWNYYDDSFNWNYSNDIINLNYEFTNTVFRENGYSQEEAKSFIESGFICFDKYEMIIDRFYGGALTSIDSRTRFLAKDFRLEKMHSNNNVWVYKAKSWSDVKREIDERTASPNRKYLFRGQNQNYFINRKIKNPFFTINGLGEISLLPSFWRKMLSKNQYSFMNFSNLSLLEWSGILYSKYDIEEIGKRHQKLIEQGELVFTMGDMEDCSDPVLREFGKYRLDLAMGINHNLADVLATLLQHYGLYSPVLDLTKSLSVAIFFATHKFHRYENYCNYEYVGTNNRNSVIYVFREDNMEMTQHNEREPIIKFYDPLRPKKQDCIICRSDTYALNPPADFLAGIVLLDFDTVENYSRLSVKDIFPNEKEDLFLNALKQKLFMKEHITDFYKNN